MRRLLALTMVLGCLCTSGDAARAGLVGHWLLDEGSGTAVADSSGSGLDGTIPFEVYPSAWTTDTPPTAFPNPYALSFDGSNDFVDTPFAGIGGADPRTVAAWVKTTSTANHGIVAWGDSGSNGTKYHVRVNSSAGNGTLGALRTEVQGGYRIGSTVIADGQWHHIVSMLPAGADDQEQVLLYVDGALEAVSGGGTRTINTTLGVNDVTIGRRTQGTNLYHLPGLIDDVRFYDVELTEAEISGLAGATPKTDNLVAHWNFDEGPGSTAAADSAGGNAGTLMNMTVDEAPAWSSDAPPAPASQTASIDFDGSRGFVDTSFAGIGGSDARTITAWVKTESTAQHGIVAWGDSGTNGAKWHFRLNDNAGNGVQGALRTEVSGGYIIGSTNVADGQWHHVASVFAPDGDPNVEDVLLYLDGELEAVSGVNPFEVNTDVSETAPNVTIGRRTQGTTYNYLDGLLADVRIYDEALDAGAIRGLAVPEPSTLALLAAGVLGVLGLLWRRRRA